MKGIYWKLLILEVYRNARPTHPPHTKNVQSWTTTTNLLVSQTTWHEKSPCCLVSSPLFFIVVVFFIICLFWNLLSSSKDHKRGHFKECWCCSFAQTYSIITKYRIVMKTYSKYVLTLYGLWPYMNAKQFVKATWTLY